MPLLLYSQGFLHWWNFGCSSCLSFFTAKAFFTDGTLAVPAASPSLQPKLIHFRNSSCSSCFLQSLSFFTAEILAVPSVSIKPRLLHWEIWAVQISSPSLLLKLFSLMELWLFKQPCLLHILNFFTTLASCHVLLTWSNYFKKCVSRLIFHEGEHAFLVKGFSINSERNNWSI